MPKISEEFASNYLKADDLEDGDRVFTIDSAEIIEFKDKETGTTQKKVKLAFREVDKALLLNATNRNTLVGLLGDDTDDWEGKKITLYPSEVNFGGKMVPCIRIKSKLPKAKESAKAASSVSEGGDAPF